VSTPDEVVPIPFLAPVTEVPEQAHAKISPISVKNLDSPPEVKEKNNKDFNPPIEKLSNSPDSVSNSSENESESSEKQKKKPEKNEHEKKSFRWL